MTMPNPSSLWPRGLPRSSVTLAASSSNWMPLTMIEPKPEITPNPKAAPVPPLPTPARSLVPPEPPQPLAMTANPPSEVSARRRIGLGAASIEAKGKSGVTKRLVILA